MELLEHELSSKILKAFYKVYNELGFGFLEKVYLNALFIELISMGLLCEKNKQIKVYYQGHMVSDYFADMFVENKIILELKASEILVVENEYQLINYLKATEIEVGLLLNFGKRPEFRRKIFTNEQKKLRAL